MIPNAGPLPTSVTPQRWKWAIVAFASVAILENAVFPAFLSLAPREQVVGFVADDAYYYFNVAMHLAAGDGPTADGVTRTTGFHPLYGFLLAGLYRFTQPSLDGFVAQAVIINAVGCMLAGVFLGLAARRWWGATAGWAAALLWWTNPHVALVAADSMEGGVYAFALSVLLWRTVDFLFVASVPGSIGRAAWKGAVLGATASVAVLSRTDALLIVAAIGAVALVSHADRRTKAVTISVFTLLVSASVSWWWWYCWDYTGSIVQGSAAVKREWNAFLWQQQGSMAPVNAAIEWGKYAVKSFFKVSALKWVICGVPFLFGSGRPVRRMSERSLACVLCVLPLILGAAYCVFLDRPRTWYYVPSLVMLTLLAAGATGAVLDGACGNKWASAVKRWAPVFALLVIVESAGVYARDAALPLLRESQQVQGVRAAQWLEENVAPGDRVGCWHSGIVQFYTPYVNVINLDGLANNDILSVLRRRKTMNQYWDELGIRMILGGPREKMGGYEREWDGKRLETCGLDGKLQCVVEDATSSPRL